MKTKTTQRLSTTLAAMTVLMMMTSMMMMMMMVLTMTLKMTPDLKAKGPNHNGLAYRGYIRSLLFTALQEAASQFFLDVVVFHQRKRDFHSRGYVSGSLA